MSNSGGTVGSAATTDDPSAPSGLLTRVATLALVSIIVAVLGARMLGAAQFTYINWGDRDLMRAAQLATNFETTGAELSYGSGARIPGGTQYYLMALPMLLSDSPLTVYRFMLLLDTLGVVVLFACIRRTHGTLAGLVACGTYLTSQVMWDNMSKLWNPGFLPLFVALGYYFLVRIIANGEVKFLKWVFLCLGIAAHMHFSGVLLMLLFGLVLLRFRPPGLWKQLPYGFAALLLVYAPYLLSEMTNGWQNTSLMFNQFQVVEVSEGSRRSVANWENLGNILSFFSADPPTVFNSPSLQQATRGVANLIYGCFLVFIIVAPWAWLYRHARQRSGPGIAGSEKVARALFIIFMVGISYYVWDLSIHLHRGGSGRYLQILLPAYSGLTGIVVARVASWLAQHGRVRIHAVVVMAVVVAIGLQAQTLWSGLFPRQDQSIMAYHRLRSMMDVIQRETGWTLAEVAGRTILLRFDEDRGGWFWNAANSIDYLLTEAGETWHGSVDPPCAMVLTGEPDLLERTKIDDEFIAQYFDQTVPGFNVVRRFPLGETTHFVLYERSEGRCHCALSQRYVLTTEEKLLRQHYHTQPVASVAELTSADPKTRQFSAMIMAPAGMRMPARIAILFELRQSEGAVHVRMHSNQLRGQAYNGDYFALGMIGKPRLQLQSHATEEQYTIPLAYDLVGHKGILTPLEVSGHAVPEGTYTVHFLFEHIPDIDQVDWPMDNMERVETTQLITDAFAVD